MNVPPSTANTLPAMIAPSMYGEPVLLRPGTAVTANGEKLVTSASKL